MENKIENFFFAGNAVNGEPNYGLAESLMRAAETFSNATNYKKL